MDEIFGEENFVENIVWLRNPGGKSDSKYFAETKDYVLVYARNINNISINNLIEEINLKGTNFSQNEQRYWKQGSSITKSGSNSLLTDRKNLGFVIYYNSDTNDLKIGYDYDIKLVEKYIDDRKTIPENEHIYNFDQNLLNSGYVPYVPRKIHQSFGRWRMGAEKVKQLFKDNLLIFKNDNIYVKDVFYVENPYKEIKPKDWIDWTTNSKGTNELKELGLDFSSPKPTQLIRYLINLHPNKNAIVLDFFAGSGTTGQAVMQLNREDDGNRNFILCTNNQNRIGETVCAERLYRVITGKSSDKITEFDWIKNNEPYSNQSVGIYETKIMDLTFDPKISNVLKVQDLGNDAIRVLSQFSNEIINENVFNSLTTLPIIENIKRDNNPSDVIYSLLKNIDNNILDIKLTKSGEEIHLNVVSNNNSKIYEIDLKELKITEQDVIDKICNLNQDLNNKNYSEVTKIVDEFIKTNKNWFQKIY